MAIELITGYAGFGHVSSADIGAFNAGVCGTGQYVMNTGTKFAAAIESGNTVSIGSGDAVIQGRHVRIPNGSQETVQIRNGTQGRRRRDAIILRYLKDTETGIETAEVDVLRGTEVSSSETPTAPAPTRNDLLAGGVSDEMVLYWIDVNGTTLETLTQRFVLLQPLCEPYRVGDIYMSIVHRDPAQLFGGTWTEISGRFLLAASTAYPVGSMGGEASHILTANEMPAHTHTGPSHTHTGPSHSHTIPAHTHTATAAAAGAHTHTMHRWQASAAGTARYAAQGASDTPTYETGSAGSHKHTITVDAKAAFNTQASGTGVTGASGTGATGSAGSSAAHNNMPPYYAVYMWVRTA